jgi:hypothetical protein
MPLQLLTRDPRLPNFGRDTDTIATMTGAMCGAVNRGPLPGAWLRQFGEPAFQAARNTANRLAATGRTMCTPMLDDVSAVAGLASGRDGR